jgi:hypothetical protein
MGEPGPEAAQPDPTAVPAPLEVRQPAYVTLDAWLRLDRHEQERGRAQGRPRVKVMSREAMLRLALGADRVPRRGVSGPRTPQARTVTSPGLPSVASPFSVRAVSAWWPQ